MSYPFDMNLLWYVLVGILFTGYAILDGFDLGVGMHLLSVQKDLDRRILLNAIGPVWDGNEVWLVVGGGALFAAFPNVYATAFSGFYLPFMLLLVALIFRAVAIEFRSKEESPRWRHGWDVSFCIASYIIAGLMGVALGNVVLGVPIAPDGEYAGAFFNLLNPYALICGGTAIALFRMHGAIYLVMKTDGDLNAVAQKWVKSGIIGFAVAYGMLSIATFVQAPWMAERLRANPWAILLPLGAFLSIANIPREMSRGQTMRAFLSSAGAMAGMLALVGAGLFPNLLPSSTGAERSLTAYNSSASLATLNLMTTITIIGLPFVLTYTIAIYTVFRGKVDPNHLHY